MAFDIDKYTANSKAVGWADLDFDEFDSNPLPEPTLRSLRYMCDVEYHTVCYLRDLLATPSHKEPEVGAFMTMWNREEFWHGEALAAVLGEHGITVDFDELKATRLKLGWKDRLDPIKQSLMGGLVGHDFVAVHMAWGAANEWSAERRLHPPRRQEGTPGARRAAAAHRAAGGQARRVLRVAGPRPPRQEQEGPGASPASPSTSSGVRSARASWIRCRGRPRHGRPVRRRGGLRRSASIDSHISAHARARGAHDRRDVNEEVRRLRACGRLAFRDQRRRSETSGCP